MTEPVLRIAHLYADEMNIYGDRGNILTLQRRAEWRGIPVEVRAIGRGPSPDLSDIDLIFWGGGQDRDQELVFTDAARHKVQAIQAAIDGGAVVLAVCGGYQLLGEYYVTADGKRFLAVAPGRTKGNPRPGPAYSAEPRSRSPVNTWIAFDWSISDVW